MATQKTNAVKLTEDEMKELTDIRTSYQNMTSVIGDIEVNIESLKSRKEELMNKVKKLSEKQNDINRKLENKYGKGNISLDTGEFNPIKE